jgi:hypothetical protein
MAPKASRARGGRARGRGQSRGQGRGRSGESNCNDLGSRSSRLTYKATRHTGSDSDYEFRTEASDDDSYQETAPKGKRKTSKKTLATKRPRRHASKQTTTDADNLSSEIDLENNNDQVRAFFPIELEDSILGRNLQAFKTALATVKINKFAAKSSDATALSTLLGQNYRGRRLQFVKAVEKAPSQLGGKKFGAIVVQNHTPGEPKWSGSQSTLGFNIQTYYTLEDAKTMGPTLCQLLEGYPGYVGPRMDKTAMWLLIAASAMLNNCQKKLPSVRYMKSRGERYCATARFIDPETGKSGGVTFSVVTSKSNFRNPLADPSTVVPPRFQCRRHHPGIC